MWYPVVGRPGNLFKELNWSPAIELNIRHNHWDKKSRHPASPGIFIDRHVQPDCTLPVTLVDRNAKDIYMDSECGASVALESGVPDKSRGIGGVLYDEDKPEERFQREWDFLEGHLKEALVRYNASLPLMNHNDWITHRRDKWSDGEICLAIARYAVNWKSRCYGEFLSANPVDTLMHSFHCGGISNISMALAMVAGIPARRIATTGHSTVEFLINGNWYWSDNIRQGVLMHSGSYQDYLTGLNSWVHDSEGQKEHHRKAEVFYRAPYDYSSSMLWRLGGELPEGASVGLDENNNDAASGYGLSVHYDPSTAKALYPNAFEYVFHANQAREPWLTIAHKGAWLHAPLALGDCSVRRKIYLSECGDNPVEAGELRVWVMGDDSDLSASVDGVKLKLRGIETQRHLHKAAVFEVPKDILQAGWHEFVIRGLGTLVFYPDIMDSYEPCVSATGMKIEMSAVLTDPIWTP